MLFTAALERIIARCCDNHSALLMHMTSSGLGYSTQPPFRRGDHDHLDEMEAGLVFMPGQSHNYGLSLLRNGTRLIQIF